mgnify:FL=1
MPIIKSGKIREEEMRGRMNKRIYWLDVARVCAMLGTIVIHIACINWYDIPIKPYPWLVYNLFDCIFRYCVPVFLMISGYLFLNPEKDFSVKKLYSRNIKRLVTAFFFWSFLYALITSGFATQRTFSKEIVEKFVHDLFYGHYHMWYLYAMLGMYLITPALRAVAKNRKAMQYFLILSFVMSYVLPTLQMIPTVYVFAQFTYRIDISMVSGYSFYYLMGYYLGSEEITKERAKKWYLLSALGFLITFVATSLMCILEQYPDIRMHEYLTAGVCLYSCGAFVFFKRKFENVDPDSRMMKVIGYLSELSFGIYLANDFGIIIMKKIGLVPKLFNPVLSVILLVIVDFAFSTAIAALIHKIPFLRKHVM